MPIDPEKRKVYLMILAGVLGVLMIGGIVFLGSEFRKIDQEGVKCLNNPLTWAEFVMHEQKNKDFSCTCQEDRGFNLDYQLNWSQK
jgi:hypothetical protein